ncbi:DUF2244 domain-containing protein [Elioraea sp.]|uniref:DUF2244 domain-containing protein n=1 Tax=Elioraea sp. TaxID=2185103 RepID=UPI003F6E8D4D
MTRDGDPPVFTATLRPQRSLDRSGLCIAASVLGVSGAAIAGLFLVMGAWPVVGFVGIEIAIVIALLLLHHGRGRTTEEVVLDDRALTVTRRRGRAVTRWEFPPGWLRVTVVDDEDGRPAGVLLASHGRRLAVGRFLTPEEQTEFAAALRAALASWRAPYAAAC